MACTDMGVHRLWRLARAVDRGPGRAVARHAGQRSFDSSWVGLDVLEAVCLLSVAQLMRRQHRATSPAAAATAAILCVDAWFDTMSAAPQLPYAEALAMACFAELPLAALLAWTAWHSLKWAAPREDMITTRAGSRPPRRRQGDVPVDDRGELICVAPLGVLGRAQ